MISISKETAGVAIEALVEIIGLSSDSQSEPGLMGKIADYRKALSEIIVKAEDWTVVSPEHYWSSGQAGLQVDVMLQSGMKITGVIAVEGKAFVFIKTSGNGEVIPSSSIIAWKLKL
jgi:hypothetical protein